MDSTETRTSGGKTLSSGRTAPLKPKPGLNGATHPQSHPMPRNYLGSEYVPSQAKLVEPSGFPVALQVPLAFIPLNFPVPLVACHVFVPDCILPSAVAPVNW